MAILNPEQQRLIRQGIYEDSRSCSNCYSFDEAKHEFVMNHWKLEESVRKAFEKTRLTQEVEIDFTKQMKDLILELDLHCPNCNFHWTEEFQDVSDHFVKEATPGGFKDDNI